MPKQFINSKHTVVTEALSGLCSTTPCLTRLDGFPDIKVVVDSTRDRESTVAVLSGGGAGHEPAHAGFTGPGMLSATVVGDVFASPPAEAVLAGIQAVTGQPGCLLLVMNYTGDRLNFGLAAEQAKSQGLKVEMVVIGDDCALPDTGLAGRRGIAGAVLVNKIAGAAAAAGLPLEEVRAEAESAARSVGSMGVAAAVCTLPGSEASTRLAEDEIEMGLGIHGEPGASKRKIASVDSIVLEVVEAIIKYMQIAGSQEEFALLVNNLGAASCLEMGVIANSAMQYISQTCGLRIARSYVGTFMTSLDMHGFSITLMQLTARRKQLLDAPTQVPAWPDKPADFALETPLLPAPASEGARSYKRPARLTEFGCAAEAAVSAAANALIEAAAQLDDLDKRVGDGDCGSTLKRGADAIRAALQDSLPLNDAGPLSRCIADCARTCGGTSGALYNIFFTAAAGKLQGSVDVAALATAFSAGAHAIEEYGGAAQGSRTMLDALLPAAEALEAAAKEGKSPAAAAQAAAEAAETGSEATKEMAAGAGRSSYVPEAHMKGIPDPGAKAVATWLAAVAEAVARH